MRFTDKVVAITGAAQGIGRQTAEQAAAEGAALLLIDRAPWVRELAATLAQSGSQVGNDQSDDQHDGKRDEVLGVIDGE